MTASAVAGLGFRAGATLASLRSALQAACASSKGAAGTPLLITALATAADKAAHPALTELARERGLPLIAVPLAQLSGPGPEASLAAHSRIPERYGKRSLAESSALAAAGPGAQLLAPRAVSADKMATASIAILHPHIANP